MLAPARLLAAVHGPLRFPRRSGAPVALTLLALALPGCADEGGTGSDTEAYSSSVSWSGGGVVSDSDGTGGSGSGGGTTDGGTSSGGGTTATGTSTGGTTATGTSTAGTTATGTSTAGTTATGTSTGGTTATGTTGGGDDVPQGIPYCADVVDWDPSWANWEEEVLELVNQERAQGGSCPAYGSFPATHPLTMQPNLRCAARVHALDMDTRGFFDHTNPDGEGPDARATQAGYQWLTVGENIATGQPSPSEVMDAWMNSGGHCRNILRGEYYDIGVGYYPGGDYGHLWVQVFGDQ